LPDLGLGTAVGCFFSRCATARFIASPASPTHDQLQNRQLVRIFWVLAQLAVSPARRSIAALQ
jgi:hypothetical protein